MTGDLFELGTGEKVPVIAEQSYHDATVYVLYRVEAAHEWIVTWTDGINWWYEEYDRSWHAFARVAALLAAIEQQVFLVHDVEARFERDAFVAEAERFVSRTVQSV